MTQEKNLPQTPDNGILFLNDGIQVRNPTMSKTPPPPLWGTVIEEDQYDMSQPFYDGKRAAEQELKRRIEERVKSGEINAGK